MTFNEKKLYHQIHPVKLFTDISTAFVSTYLLWQHMLLYAILLAIVPSILVSVILIRNSDLEKYRNSTFGQYLKKHMDSRITDAARLGGFFIMAIGGWLRNVGLIGAGFFMITACWSKGILYQRLRNLD